MTNNFHQYHSVSITYQPTNSIKALKAILVT